MTTPPPIARPFLKWAGGKSKLVPMIRELMPARYETYFEPFLGGGALFFAVAPLDAQIGDANVRLVSTYLAVRDKPDQTLDALDVHRQLHSREHYYKVRERFQALTNGHGAADFIYLNKTCFNGLYRVNAAGDFNVPWGKHETFTPDVDGLSACALALENATICSFDFETQLRDATRGDFVYLDPPYLPETKASFTRYTMRGFDWSEHERLANVARKLKAAGVHVIASNSDTPATRLLWKGWRVREVTRAGTMRVGELLLY